MCGEKANGCKCCLIAGILLIALGVLADVIGIGKMDGFGYKQFAAIVVGIVFVWFSAKDCKFGKFCKLGKKEETVKQEENQNQEEPPA